MTPEETKYYDGERVGPIPVLIVNEDGCFFAIDKSTKNYDDVRRSVLNMDLLLAAQRIYIYHHITRKLK